MLHLSGRRQTRANGHTVETGHDGVFTAVPRIVIGTPDGGKTTHRRDREGFGVKDYRGMESGVYQEYLGAKHKYRDRKERGKGRVGRRHKKA